MDSKKYYYAYHSQKNCEPFDFKKGYGFSVEGKRDKIEIGSLVFVIQKLKTEKKYQLCGLYEIDRHYDALSNQYPFRLALKCIVKLEPYINIDTVKFSALLPEVNQGFNSWSKFHKHFCSRGISFNNKLNEDVIAALTSLLPNSTLTLTDALEELDKAVKVSSSLSSKERLKRLRKAPKQPDRITVTTTAFKRNPDVIVETLIRAKGICERCKKKAPFVRKSNGEPYLEVHHVTPLSIGGEDTLENTLALCPNCHRDLHFGINTKIKMR